MHELQQQATIFLEKVFKALEQDGIPFQDWELDHICYRVEEEEEYTEMKNFLESKQATLLVESLINSRRIATYELGEPLLFGQRQIFLFELPEPKEGSPYRRGFEHVEFVVPSLHDLQEAHPNLKWDKKGLNKPINADLRLKYEGFAVKFHEQSLAKVIEEEKKMKKNRQ